MAQGSRPAALAAAALAAILLAGAPLRAASTAVPGDTCPDAIAIGLPSHPHGDTTDATFTGTSPACDGVTHEHPDQWYRIVGTGEDIVCQARDSDEDYYQMVAYLNARLTVWTGDCGDLACVAAAESVLDGFRQVQPLVTWPSEAGKEYLIMVHGINRGAVGTYQLFCRAAQTLGNDECALAAPLPVDGSWVLGDTGFMTDSSDWYTVTGTGNHMICKVARGPDEVNPGLTDDLFNPRLAVLTGDCDDLEIPDTKFIGHFSHTSWFAELGTTYHVVVRRGNLVGQYEISCVESEDLCSTAPLLELGVTVEGSTERAPLQVTPDNGACGTAGHEYTAHWYKVIGNGQIIDCDTGGRDRGLPSQLTVWTGGCAFDDLICVNSRNEHSEPQLNRGARVAWSSEAGVEYWTMVHAAKTDLYHTYEDYYYYYYTGLPVIPFTEYALTCTTYPSVENDKCVNAVPLSDGVVVEDDLRETGVEFSGPIEGDNECVDRWNPNVGNGPDRWYTFVAASDGEVECELESFDKYGNTPGYSTGPGLIVWSGSSCDDLECVAVTDSSYGYKRNEPFDVVAGVTYYVVAFGGQRDYGYFGGAFGTGYLKPYNIVCSGPINPPAPSPPPSPPSIRSDPHFRGIDGSSYDVTGVVDTFYSILSDSGIAVNALFSTAYTTGLDAATGHAYHAKGTWMTAVGVVTPEGTLEVHANGTVAASPGMTGVVSKWPRVAVSTPSMDLDITAVPPFAEWGVPAAKQADLTHINLSFRRFAPGPHAHGLLGVTGRPNRVGAPAAAHGKDGEGVIEGDVAEYAVEGLLGTAFKYSAYGTGARALTGARVGGI